MVCSRCFKGILEDEADSAVYVGRDRYEAHYACVQCAPNCGETILVESSDED